MSMYDDRLAALERKVAMMELRRTHDERKAEESTPSALGVNLKEITENMTILLGIFTKQEENVRDLTNSVDTMRERVDRFDRRLEDVDGRLISFERNVNNRFEAFEQNANKRFEAFEQNVNNRFEAQDKRFDGLEQRFDQVLSLLSKLASGPQQEI